MATDFDPKAFTRNMQCNNTRDGEPVTHQGRPMKLNSGDWGAWVEKSDNDLLFEDIIEITTRAGKKFNKLCMSIVCEKDDGYVVQTV